MSFPEIAEWLGRRNHSPMIAACNRAEREQGERLDELEAELLSAREIDGELVRAVLARPSAIRLMIARLQPLLAANERTA